MVLEDPGRSELSRGKDREFFRIARLYATDLGVVVQEVEG